MDLQDVGWEGMDWTDLAASCEYGSKATGFDKMR